MLELDELFEPALPELDELIEPALLELDELFDPAFLYLDQLIEAALLELDELIGPALLELDERMDEEKLDDGLEELEEDRALELPTELKDEGDADDDVLVDCTA